jgi:hypothetical protein
MAIYILRCRNGYSAQIYANSLVGAKRKATSEIPFGSGRYTLTTPDGEVYERHQWHRFGESGWENWKKR